MTAISVGWGFKMAKSWAAHANMTHCWGGGWVGGCEAQTTCFKIWQRDQIYTHTHNILYTVYTSVCVLVDLWFSWVRIDHWMSQFLSLCGGRRSHFYKQTYMLFICVIKCKHRAADVPVHAAVLISAVCVFVCISQVQGRVERRYRRVFGLKVSFIASIFGPGYFLHSGQTVWPRHPLKFSHPTFPMQSHAHLWTIHACTNQNIP